MKQCSKCKFDLPAGAFWADNTKRDGLQSVCKPCQHSHNVSSAGQARQDRYEARVWARANLVEPRLRFVVPTSRRRYIGATGSVTL